MCGEIVRKWGIYPQKIKESRMFLDELTFDLSVGVLKALPVKDALKLGRINKDWKRALETESLWKIFCLRYSRVSPSPILSYPLPSPLRLTPNPDFT